MGQDQQPICPKDGRPCGDYPCYHCPNAMGSTVRDTTVCGVCEQPDKPVCRVCDTPITEAAIWQHGVEITGRCVYYHSECVYCDEASGLIYYPIAPADYVLCGSCGDPLREDVAVFMVDDWYHDQCVEMCQGCLEYYFESDGCPNCACDLCGHSNCDCGGA